jgi:hypothetical protein
MDKFKPYLFGPQFTWITDAKCLTWLHRVKDTTPKLLSWCLQAQGIDFSVQHKPGKHNVVSDALRRILHRSDANGDANTSIDTATLATLLVLDVEPLTPLAASPDDIATAFNAARNLCEDRNVPASDECAMNNFVASVATAIPDRDEVAKAQRADSFFGPIITALQRTESARTLRHGNEYALSDRLHYRLPKGKSPDSARPRICVPIDLIPTLFDFYHNSPSDGHINGLRTYDRIRLLYF